MRTQQDSMPDISILRQYHQFKEWEKDAPPSLRALLSGIVWFMAWVIGGLLLGGRSFVKLATVGGFSSLVWGYLQYHYQYSN